MVSGNNFGTVKCLESFGRSHYYPLHAPPFDSNQTVTTTMSSSSGTASTVRSKSLRCGCCGDNTTTTTTTTTTATPEKTVISGLLALCVVWVMGCTFYVALRLHHRHMLLQQSKFVVEHHARPVSPQAALMAQHQQQQQQQPFLRNGLNNQQPPNARNGTTSMIQHQQQHQPQSRPTILSRARHHVTATADVRGNLGPIDVVLQDLPGTNWLKDRWQAASDMHGTNIPGAHWIQLDFGQHTANAAVSSSLQQQQQQQPHLIRPTSIVLDWEAAYAQDYVLQASATHPLTGHPDHQPSDGTVWTLFDGRQASQRRQFLTKRETGQSPGVKQPTPLHVIHTIQLLVATNNNTSPATTITTQSSRPLRYLRLFILKSARGWGVSLWQFDVYGYYSDATTTTTIRPPPSSS